jgi:hypothetical protein
VLLLRTESESSLEWPPSTLNKATSAIRKASTTNSLLMGKVNMVKYEPPHHIGKPRRILFYDLVYLWNKYVNHSREMPPWEMAISKPEEYTAYQQALELKKRGAGYPYWKPEVSIKYVNDDSSYPYELSHLSGMPLVKEKNSREHPTGAALMPAMHVDEMGMTSEKVSTRGKFR